MKRLIPGGLVCCLWWIASFPTTALAETVLITGANSGIGLEFTRQYAAKGWTVIATHRRSEAPKSLADIAAKYAKLRIERLGRHQTSNKSSALATKLAKVPIDVLINNAGVYNDRTRACRERRLPWRLVARKLRQDALRPARHHHGGERQRAAHRLRSLPRQREGEHAEEARGRQLQHWPAHRRARVRPGSIFYRLSKAALNRSMQIVASTAKPDGVTVVMLNPGPTLTERQAYLKGIQRNVEDLVHRGTHDQDDRQSDDSGHRQIPAIRRNGRAMGRTVVVLAAAIGVTIMSAGCKHDAS